MKRVYTLHTESGSVYEVREDLDGTWWIRGDNVPNPYSGPLGDTWWQIKAPLNPPVEGHRFYAETFFMSEFDNPKRMPGGGKYTSYVTHVTEFVPE